LADPAIAQGAATVNIGQVPMANFRDNVGYASVFGLLVRYHLEDSTHGARSLFENSTFWNNTIGVGLHYVHNTVVRNLTVVHGQDVPSFAGIQTNLASGNIEYDNLTVAGYLNGIELPRWGNNVVKAGSFRNVNDIVIATAAVRERSILLSGFTDQPRIELWQDLSPIGRHSVAIHLVRDAIILNPGSDTEQQLYFPGQRPDSVLFPVARSDTPAEYIGLTSQQLLDQFGVALGGMLAPTDVFTVPLVKGGLVVPKV
jgi:hypothetical protein